MLALPDSPDIFFACTQRASQNASFAYTIDPSNLINALCCTPHLLHSSSIFIVDERKAVLRLTAAMIVKRHILQRFLEAMGYEVLLHRIASERVPGQVCGVKTKNAAAEVESLKTAALDIARICPKDAAVWGFEAPLEVIYHLKRHKYDSARGVLYFPTVFWNAERFSSSFARDP